MKPKLRSLLALVLALCMAASLLCTTVWAAEADVSAPDASASSEVPEPQEAPAEESAPAEEDAAAAEESTPAPAEKDAAAAEEDAAPAEEDAAPAEESTPAPAEEATDEAEEADPAQEEAPEPQEKPAYHPVALSARSDGSKVSATINHGTRPVPAKKGMLIIIEGAEDGTNDWQECENMDLSNHWTSGQTSLPCGSDEGSWGCLALITKHSYVFRACYTNEYGERGDYAYSEPITYHSAAQDKAALQAAISAVANSPVAVTHNAEYNEQHLIPGQTWVKYDHPLFTATFTCTGVTTASTMGSNYDQGDTLLSFRADYSSKQAGNGFEEGDARWVPGVYYYPECYYYVDKNGQDQYEGLSAKQNASGSYEFYVNLDRMGYGCSHLKFRLGAFQFGGYDYGVSKTVDLEPLYFNVGFGKTPLYAFCPTSTKNSATIRPFEVMGGSAINYLGAVPTYTGNVQDNGVNVWYRKKGTNDWTPQSFTRGQAITITGLKPDTVYEWKAQYYLKSQNHSGELKTITAEETPVYEFATAVKKKPKVKSCKVSKVKVVKHQIAGHWEKSGTNSIKWVKTQTWYTTDFKVTFTFAKPSKNIKGYVCNGVYAPVKKGKVTFSMSVGTGKKKTKAKKFTAKLQSCTNVNGPSGLSPTLKYNGKIKK